NREAGVASSLAAALKVGAALPLVCAVRVASVSIGLLACFVPGVSVLAAMAFAPHGVVLEKKGVSGAVLRGLKLSAAGATGLAAAGALTIAIYVIGTLQLLLAARLGEALVTIALPSFPGGWLTRPEAPWLLLAAA